MMYMLDIISSNVSPTEEVGAIAKYISEYGPLTVILAIFLLLFLMTSIYIVRSHQKSIDSDREMNTQLVTSILNDYFAKNDKLLEERHTYNEKKIVDIFIKLNNALKSACENTNNKLKSDRTAIYVFHNGSQASHGLPFFKMSCISEWVSKNSNLNIKLSDHSAIPLTLFDTIVANLYENSEYRIIKSKITDPGESLFLKNTRIEDCFFIPIYDEENSMMGFIFNGYNRYDENRDLEREKRELLDLAKVAKPVIEFSKFQDQMDKEKEG